MQYPSREAEILRLANDIAAGLAAHTEVFPAAPFSPEELEQALAEHDGNREAAIQARATAAQSTADKDGSLAKIQDMSKSVIRYAENHSRGDDGQLQLLGWGGRRSRTVTVTEPPGQPRTLEVIREGKNWIFLDWKESMEGGEVAAYRVQRRARSGDHRLPPAAPGSIPGARYRSRGVTYARCNGLAQLVRRGLACRAVQEKETYQMLRMGR